MKTVSAAEFVRDVGRALIKHAKRSALRPGRELVGELFPYIWEAAQELSPKLISDWLMLQYGVCTNPTTIRRALQCPGPHWRAWYERVEPYAQSVAAEWGQIDARDFLGLPGDWEDVVKAGFSPSASSVERAKEQAKALEIVRKDWFGLDESTRRACLASLGKLPSWTRKPPPRG